jgi:hypothetical protein
MAESFILQQNDQLDPNAAVFDHERFLMQKSERSETVFLIPAITRGQSRPEASAYI